MTRHKVTEGLEIEANDYFRREVAEIGTIPLDVRTLAELLDQVRSSRSNKNLRTR